MLHRVVSHPPRHRNHRCHPPSTALSIQRYKSYRRYILGYHYNQSRFIPYPLHFTRPLVPCRNPQFPFNAEHRNRLPSVHSYFIHFYHSDDST